VQEVALVDVQASFTAWPKWIEDACAGELNFTDACGVGGGPP
jgi:hypothetical protein